MPVDAHLARAVAASRVVAREPGFVVGARLGAEGAFELRDDGERAECCGTRRGGAGYAGGRAAVCRRDEAFEEEGGLAGAAAQGQACRVLEADRVRDLGLEGEDVVLLVGTGGGGGDGVFTRVEAKAFGEADGVGAIDGGAEALDGREDLLVEIPFDVGFEARIGAEDVLRRVGALGCRFGGGFGIARHNVRHHVVDAWVFAFRYFTQGDLNLGHALGVGVVFGVLAEFLGLVSER